MKIVLDTNCFISCIGRNSNYKKVFDWFLNKKFTLCLSSEVLLEYEEIFTNFWGEQVTSNLLGVLLTIENTQLQPIFYNFNLVSGDVDDNKFSDLYLAASADVLVSNDKKLLVLVGDNFPTINVMTLQEFSDYFENLNSGL